MGQGNNGNLKRGATPADALKGAEATNALFKERTERADSIVQYATMGEMLEAQRQVYGKLLALADRHLDRALRSRGDPPRVLIEVARELRQTADRLYDLIKSQSATSEAESFFAELDTHLEVVASRLEAGARPFVPSR